MRELPRSRALMRLDGPGHIMPVEPVTPPGSRAWRVMHLPVILAIVAITSLSIAALALDLLGLGFRFVTYIPGARRLAPVVGATAVVIAYRLFVRIVERRPSIEELGAHGCWSELGLGACGGLGVSLASFAILYVLGAVRVVGINPPQTMLTPLIVQLCTAVALEIVVCGLGYRLVERLLGSWLALSLTLLFFGAARLFGEDAVPLAVLAVALEAVLLFAVLYVVTRRLWAAIGIHAAWKFAQIGLYGDALTVGEPHGLLRSRLVGPDWLTGGSAGPDASVPAICLDALMIAILLSVAVRRGRIVRPVWRRGKATGRNARQA